MELKELFNTIKNKNNSSLEIEEIKKWFQEKNQIKLNIQQENVFKSFCEFALDKKPGIFVIKGHAGTGKTTLINLLLCFLEYLNYKNNLQNENIVLLAPTGKASRNIEQKIKFTQFSAQTVHSLLYQYVVVEKIKYKNLSSSNKNILNDLDIKEIVRIREVSKNLNYIIVDEASMLSDNPFKANADTNFRKHINCSGFTLRDLLQTFSQNSKIILIGDEKQLPPVELSESLAFSENYLKKFSTNIIINELTIVQRYNSKALVEVVKTLVNYINKKENNFYHISALDILLKHAESKYNDNSIYKYIDSIEETIRTYVQIFNENKSIIGITYRNEQAQQLNQLIRNYLNKKPFTVDDNDILIVTQNNYFYKLLNGDLFSIKKVHKEEIITLRTFLGGQKQLIDIKTFIITPNLNDKFTSPIQKYYKDIEKPIQVIFNQKIIINDKEIDIKTLIKHDFFIRYYKLLNAIRKKSKIESQDNIKEFIGNLFDEHYKNETLIENLNLNVNESSNNLENNSDDINQKVKDQSFIKEMFDTIFNDEKLENTDLNKLRVYLSVLLKFDKTFNILMVDFGYVITCHKAQGSEWENVMLMEYPTFLDIKSIRWLYTAITRTSKNLYICNIPRLNFQISVNQVKPIISIGNNDNRIIENVQKINSDDFYYYIHDILQNQYRIPKNNATLLSQYHTINFPITIIIHKGKIVNVLSDDIIE